MQRSIRKGNVTDLADILDLVKELAAYENAASQVTATVAKYEKGFLDGDFETLVAESEEGIIGVAVFYLTWSTWRGRMLYLEDLVVREGLRRSGVGQQLFDALIGRAKDLECALVKWQVLDWNEPALRFYEKNGAAIEKEWWNVKIVF